MDKLTLTAAALCALTALFTLSPARAGALEDGLTEIQHDREIIRYQTPAAEREKRYEALLTKAHRLSESQPGRSEPLIWEGIVVSSLAGEKGGLGALSLVKEAKSLYEEAIKIDGTALDGSAYNSLGVLYYKVPGWPLGFGDKDKARKLLQQALALNPKGIDPNFFYGEYLLESKQVAGALGSLERAMQAPSRPGRQIADAGRREETRELIDKAKR